VDRKEFFDALWRRTGRSVLNVIEDTAIDRGVQKFVETVDPARNQEVWERPPGALSEADFLKACIGCDQCMVACPVNVIMVDDLERRDPLIYPEKAPCIHCDGYPCISACPTGALSTKLLLL
jgi:ferredoxin